jgi:hypothetical protein
MELHHLQLPGSPVCQNRHQEIFIRSEISGVLEQTTRDSENGKRPSEEGSKENQNDNWRQSDGTEKAEQTEQ